MVRAKHPGAYDDMDDAALEAAVVAKYPGVYDDLVTPKAAPTAKAPARHPHAAVADAVADTAKGVWNAVSAIPGAIKQTVMDPIGTVGGMLESQGRVGVQAKEALDQGDYLTAARKGVNYLLPVVGPMMDASADQMMSGDVPIMESVGELGANAAMMASGMRPRPKPGVTVKKPIMAGPTNSKEAAAVALARERGVPLDLATATGSQPARNWQKTAGNTWAGHSTAVNMRQSQAAALERVGGELADQAAPTATNAVAAGEGVRAALTTTIQDLAVKADTAYNALREFEKQSELETVTTGRKTVTQARPTGAINSAEQPISQSVTASQPVSAEMRLAVDLKPTKPQLKPIYDSLLREAELGIPMQGAKGRALKALDGIMRGPDYMSLSALDAALGDLKAMARGAEMPELRTQGQGIAAEAVKRLDAQVRKRAAQAGPDVLKALEDGRAATTQKYAVADVLDLLSGEPGQVFRQLTQAKDVGLARLRAVEKIAPNELPNVGRALLEDMLQTATQEGGFGHGAKLWADWNKLGAETKARLFKKPGQTQALDDFFMLSKKIDENPNPSGTGTMPKLNVAELFAAIPAWAAAKMLMTPAGVKYLTTARVAYRSPSRAAQSLAAAQLSKAAQSAGVPLEAIPAFAGEPERSGPTRKAQ